MRLSEIPSSWRQQQQQQQQQAGRQAGRQYGGPEAELPWARGVAGREEEGHKK